MRHRNSTPADVQVGGSDPDLDARLSQELDADDVSERVARERGCQRLTVSCFTFQAPDFHERHGIEFARTDRLPSEGQADEHFVKMLVHEVAFGDPSALRRRAAARVQPAAVGFFVGPP